MKWDDYQHDIMEQSKQNFIDMEQSKKNFVNMEQSNPDLGVNRVKSESNQSEQNLG